MRIEINLTEEIVKLLQLKADELNQSRKAYIELLCMKDVKQVKKSKHGITKIG